MARLLFIWYKRSKGILEGGGQGSTRNYTQLCNLLGKDNVDSFYVHDEYRKKTLWGYVKGVFFTPFGYYYGLTPGRVRSIVRIAKGEQALEPDGSNASAKECASDGINLPAPYDIVFLDRSLFGIVAKQLKEAGYQGRIMVYFHNVETIYFDAKLGHIPGKSVFMRCVARNDAYSCRYADCMIAINKRDEQTLQTLYGRKADALISCSMADRLGETNAEAQSGKPDAEDRVAKPSAKPSAETSAEDRAGEASAETSAETSAEVEPNAEARPVMTRPRPRCLFLGTYFAPNNEGILWFVRNVLPHVDIEMLVVGKGMARLKAEAPELKDIEVVSDAPDLRPYLEDADLMILPIFSGSGMKIKTCESLMFGKNILGTREAFEGYEGDYDRIGAMCNSADDFISAIQGFISSPRPRFNAYSRQLYLDHYSMQASARAYGQLLDSIGSLKPAPAHAEASPSISASLGQSSSSSESSTRESSFSSSQAFSSSGCARPLLAGKRVKFFCRSFSLELYRLSSALYAQAGYPCVRLTDRTADGYFYAMLDDGECDVAINVDEDAFVSDLDAVLDMAEMALREGYVNVGCPDAGPGMMRRGAPEVTNPFFNVFNLELIRTKWEAGVMPARLAKERAAGCLEPYYPFFRWLLAAFPDRTCYVSAHKHNDRITTVIATPEGRDFVMHTWFARFYRPSVLSYLFEGNTTGSDHTTRIDRIIDEAYRERSLTRPKFGLADKCAFACNGVARWGVKIPQRIAGWPRKLMAKLKKSKK